VKIVAKYSVQIRSGHTAIVSGGIFSMVPPWTPAVRPGMGSPSFSIFPGVVLFWANILCKFVQAIPPDTMAVDSVRYRHGPRRYDLGWDPLPPLSIFPGVVFFLAVPRVSYRLDLRRYEGTDTASGTI